MASLSGTTGGTGGLGGTVGGWNVGFGGKNIGRRVGRTDTLGSRTTGGKAGQPAATVAKKVEKAKAPVSVAPTQDVIGRRALGAIRNVKQTLSEIDKELGPGEYTSSRTFEPERGVLGSFRDMLPGIGAERTVSPTLAATAKVGGVLGEMTQGIRSGVVKTEESGTRARRDPVGSALTVVDIATSIFGLPSPAQMASPIGAAFGVAPVIGTAQSLYGAFEEQQALSALSKAGMIEQAPARGVKPATLTDDQYASLSPVLGTGRAAKQVAQTAAVKPYNEEAVRRARLKGFGSTIRTGSYGITGPLAVRA